MAWYVRVAAGCALGVLLWWLVSDSQWGIACLILLAAALGAVASRPKAKPGYRPAYWVRREARSPTPPIEKPSGNT